MMGQPEFIKAYLGKSSLPYLSPLLKRKKNDGKKRPYGWIAPTFSMENAKPILSKLLYKPSPLMELRTTTMASQS